MGLVIWFRQYYIAIRLGEVLFVLRLDERVAYLDGGLEKVVGTFAMEWVVCKYKHPGARLVDS